MPIENPYTQARRCYLTWEPSIQKIRLACSSRGSSDSFFFPLNPQQRKTLEEMCKDFGGWSECRIDATTANFIVWKMPHVLGIRIEEDKRVISAVFDDLKVCDAQLVFEGLPDTTARGIAIVEITE